ncbi:uncharacterized protein LOC119607657 [Lucilia sericata]|uniref:uncharacterized protein LOC119607657 n=1 Tax=Lucilia sericata TaxID=13632 RepID=UPI0018A813E7|nr:uncharacterized protein LOC119607657 [Lucilia sericata]
MQARVLSDSTGVSSWLNQSLLMSQPESHHGSTRVSSWLKRVHNDPSRKNWSLIMAHFNLEKNSPRESFMTRHLFSYNTLSVARGPAMFKYKSVICGIFPLSVNPYDLLL